MVENKEAVNLLKRAKSNLNRGKDSSYLDLREIYIEDLCFDLQQCAEKALKSVLKYNNVEFPYTHSISKLITLLENNNISVPDEVRKSARLTPFAVETRYNDDFIQITDILYQEAVQIAEKVYNWAKNEIS